MRRTIMERGRGQRKGWFQLWGAGLLCLALVGGTTAATPVAVHLDGEPLAFSDAVPQIINQRTFLPYRAVFTALGAEVSYEAQTHTAVAVRGETTVRVPIGGSQITVVTSGVEKALEMDVASYVHEGRTYVPVRFMAEALGCLVGWDEDDRTVVLIDGQKLARELVAGGDYDYLEGYYAYLDSHQEQSWAVEGELTHRVEEEGAVLIATSAQYSGLTGAGGKMELNLTLESDWSTLYERLVATQGLTLEEAGVSRDELYADMTLKVRGDATLGKTYLYVMQATGKVDNLPLSTWLDMGHTTGLEGVDLTTLLPGGEKVGAVQMVMQALKGLTFTDKDTAMEKTREVAELTAANLTDSAFFPIEEGMRVARWTAGDTSFILRLKLNEAEEVMACSMERTITRGGESHRSRSTMERGRYNAELILDSGGQRTVFIQSGLYTPSTRRPDAKPPTGEPVTKYEE